MSTDELLSYLFDGQPHPLAQPMQAWLLSSRRYASFVTTFQDKIRKKLRTTQDQQGFLDLQLELETAYLLLQERSLGVMYEPQQSKRIRSPDFAVTFTTSLTFMLEVTRLQAEPKNSVAARLADTISGKLSQLLPQCGNILVIGVDDMDLTAGDLRAMLLGIQQRAEAKDTAFLQRHGFRDRADFFHHYQRLSEILVRAPQLETTRSITAWVNPQAKHPLPGKVRTALYRSHTAGFAA